ncbi:hypothetical protein DPMN_145692 [Dreissena polymorpha]|uniref:SCP domain-containing protein n=1 Tax=Dreissena polymorpha TaxID=45954 RepID=A0A9D4IXR7_DREPO|nr:hypothetical protein DPMN_145692 [Dreissena polymorpha]
MENDRKPTSDMDRNISEKQIMISDLEIIQKSLDNLREALSRQQNHVARDFEERVRHVYDDVINDISLIRDRVTSISGDITRGATSKPVERFQYRKDLIKRVRNETEPRGKLKQSKSVDFVDAKEFDLSESRSTEHLSDNPPIGQRLCLSSASIYTKGGRRKVPGYGCCFTGDGKTLPYRSYRPWYSLFRSPSEIWNLSDIGSRSSSVDGLDLADGTALCGDVTDDWRVKVAPYMWDGWEVPGLDKTDVEKMKLRLEQISIIRDEVADVHNEYRRKHGVPEVRVSPRLAKDAQKWAETLAMIGYPQYSNTPNRGENILVVDIDNELTGRQVVDTWYREGRHYKYSDTCWQRGTSNFTQMIWKSTNQLGVGVAKYPYHDSYIVVVQYIPPGNFNTEEDFRQNVTPHLKSKGVRFSASSDDTNTQVMEPAKYNSASHVYHERGLYNRSSHNDDSKSGTQEKANESKEFKNATKSVMETDQNALYDRSNSNIFPRALTNERLETKANTVTKEKRVAETSCKNSSTHKNEGVTGTIKNINTTNIGEAQFKGKVNSSSPEIVASQRTLIYDSSADNIEKETVDVKQHAIEEQWIKMPLKKIQKGNITSNENKHSGKETIIDSNWSKDMVETELDGTGTNKRVTVDSNTTIKTCNDNNEVKTLAFDEHIPMSINHVASQGTLKYDSCANNQEKETVYAKQQELEEQWIQIPLEKIPIGKIASTENVQSGTDSLLDSNLNTHTFETELDCNLTNTRSEVGSTTTKRICSDINKDTTLAFDEDMPISIYHVRNSSDIEIKDGNSVTSSNLQLREENFKSDFIVDKDTKRDTLYDTNGMDKEKFTILPKLNKTATSKDTDDAKKLKQIDSQVNSKSKDATGIRQKEMNINKRHFSKGLAVTHNDRCGGRMTYVSELPSQHTHASKTINEDDVMIYDHMIFVQKDKNRSPIPAKMERDNESGNVDKSKASMDDKHNSACLKTSACRTSNKDNAEEIDKNSDPYCETGETSGHRHVTKELELYGDADLEKLQSAERKHTIDAEMLEEASSLKSSDKDITDSEAITDSETIGKGKVYTYHVATLKAGPWLIK